MSQTITAIYPGSFDPFTLGHLDIVERACGIFDKVIIGIGISGSKTPLFSLDDRTAMIREACAHLDNIEVDSFNSLTIHFAEAKGAKFIIRGIRNELDFQYESQICQTNQVLAPHIDCVYLPTQSKYSHISSSLIKEIASFKGDISSLVPSNISAHIKKTLKY